jgi:hypothetical protein
VLSEEDVPIEKISDLVGHKDQTTTETVYRHQIRPVVLHGAEAMYRILPNSPSMEGCDGVVVSDLLVCSGRQAGHLRELLSTLGMV